MMHETKMELHAELSRLGRKMVEGIERNRDYSDFENRFNVLDRFLSDYPPNR